MYKTTYDHWSKTKTRRIVGLLILTILFSAAAAPLSAMDAEEIIQKMEENQVHQSAYSEGRMIIRDRFGEKESSFKSWARGEDESLIEFTSRQERGQKILRTEDEIYLYFPDAAEVIRLQGAALRDSVLGSDLSYEDMTGDKGLLDSYEVELLEDEVVDGQPCYQIDMRAVSRDVPYPRQVIWVDKELFATRKVHKYSLSGKLLKEMRIQDYITQNGKTFPARFVVEDKMKSNSSTSFIIDQIDLGVEIPEATFSLQELTW